MLEDDMRLCHADKQHQQDSLHHESLVSLLYL